MISGGITEVINHFIGYFHLTETLNRPDRLFNGYYQAKPAEDFIVKHLEIDSNPLSPNNLTLLRHDTLIAADEAVAAPRQALKLSVNAAQHPSDPSHPLKFYLPPADTSVIPAEGGSAGEQNPFISVSYEDNGGETRMTIEQINVLNNVNLLTDSHVSLTDGSGHTVDISIPDVMPMLRSMLHQAEDAVAPDTLTPGQLALLNHGDSGVIELVTSRDAGWASSGTPDEMGHTHVPAFDGRYVDGVKSDADIPVVDASTISPWLKSGTVTADPGTTLTVTITGPSSGIGASAELGSNFTGNAAYIADVSSAPGSIIIKGDYFFTKAIVQVNVLSNNDHVEVSGPNATDFSNSIFTSGNEVHNVADFVTHQMTGTFHGAAATYNWVVDTIKGNYYDVRSIDQVNNMITNTSAVQMAHNTYFDYSSGHNIQGNFANIYGADHYDLIVVEGSYHHADLIYQTNIVLNNSNVTMWNDSTGQHSSLAVTTGDNTLTNNAKIEDYEGSKFTSINAAQQDLLTRLENHDTTLLPDFNWNLSGSSSGTLKVLFVTGDFYHINAISQTNILSSVNDIVQVIPNSVSADGTFTNVSTGGNTATNTAVIVDAGTLSDSQFVGGKVYTASMLSQSNLVTDNDKVVIHDTHSLAPELIAFTDAPLTTGQVSQAAPLHTPNHDNMMDVLH